MDILITILAIYGLAFLIKETDGPWGSMALLRNKLLNNPHVGVFFFKLLDCYFCLGCWCGLIVYLLHITGLFFILWALAGGALSLILDRVMARLSAPH